MLQNSVREMALPTVKAKPVATLNLVKARSAALFIVAIALLIQLVLFFSIDNLIASALVFCGAFIGIHYAVNRQLLNEYPLSTLGIIGYTVCEFVIPPLGKLADFQSILHNLTHPVLVWIYGLTGLLALVAGHYAYRTFSFYGTIRWLLTTSFYRPLYFFAMPDELQFWLMGIIGIAATLVEVHLSGDGGRGALASAVRVLSPLIYAPLFVAYPNLIDPRYRVNRRSARLALMVYSGLVLVVSAMVNSRYFMLLGFASVALVYGYRVITGTVSPPRLTLKSSIAILFCLLLISGPLTNLAASMLIARHKRGTVSPQELAKTTWTVYRSGIGVKALEVSENQASSLGVYSETYYNNMFLNRVGNVRFTDISINAAQGTMMTGDASYFKKIEIEKVIALIPTPLLRILHLDINKNEVLSGSSEDFLYQLATGRPVGTHLTGSSLVILRMIFGMMWPVYFGLISSFTFSVFDACTVVEGIYNEPGVNRRLNCVVLSPMIAGTLFGYATFFALSQDVGAYVSALTRDWIQIGILYAFAFAFCKFVSSLMLGWTWRSRRAA